MPFTSTNPSTGLIFFEKSDWDSTKIDLSLDLSQAAFQVWRNTPYNERAEHLLSAAKALRNNKETLATLITQEMGKLLTESKAEVEKCALACEYFAQHGQSFLQDTIIPSDAKHSYVVFQPLGPVLAVMPWNFPLWQVMRFAIPALLAGNTVVLKHASNVPQCALALENIFANTDAPKHIFQTLLINSQQTQHLIRDRRITAVTLTGSTEAGKEIAATAGHSIKKTVLELGGSDPFVLLGDADITKAAQVATQSRYMNCGQSCIAAKRFIVVKDIASKFIEAFVEKARELVTGDPMHSSTTLAPMARADLRDQLHAQVHKTVQMGGKCLLGGTPQIGEGFFYPATVLSELPENSPPSNQELFGPVASLFVVKDEHEALALANRTQYGLGGSVWTKDLERGQQFARKLECGAAFVNGLVKSDPRLPFGGIKESGYGRELAKLGMREFVNAKTIWVGD